MDISSITKTSIPATTRSKSSNKPVRSSDSSVPEKLPQHIPPSRKNRRKQQRRSAAHTTLVDLRAGRGRRTSDNHRMLPVDIKI